MESLERVAYGLHQEMHQAGVFCQAGVTIDMAVLDGLLKDHFVKILLVRMEDWSVVYANETFACVMGKSSGAMNLEDQMDIRMSFDALGSMQMLQAYNHYLGSGDAPISGLTTINGADGVGDQHFASAVAMAKGKEGGVTYYLQVFARVDQLMAVNLHARYPMGELTNRQQEVALELLKGQTLEGASRELGISVKTLEKHALVVFRHTGCRNKAELIHLCQ